MDFLNFSCFFHNYVVYSKTERRRAASENEKREIKRGFRKMSQEKVNRYKEEKANRKEILAKEKKKKAVTKVVAAVIALALVCWVGYSVYDVATRPDTSTIEMDASALDSYLSSMGAEASE